MSLTPIFDATLADAPRNIWEASGIFPQPISAIEEVRTLLSGSWPPPLQPAFTDWTAIKNITRGGAA